MQDTNLAHLYLFSDKVNVYLDVLHSLMLYWVGREVDCTHIVRTSGTNLVVASLDSSLMIAHRLFLMYLLFPCSNPIKVRVRVTNLGLEKCLLIHCNSVRLSSK